MQSMHYHSLLIARCNECWRLLDPASRARKAPPRDSAEHNPTGDGLKLQIGSTTRPEGWHTLNIAAGPEVDYVGDCGSLAQFADNSIETIYASHVLEHVPYRQTEAVLREWFRVLIPGGLAMIAVPDLEALAQLYLHPQMSAQDRLNIVQMIFGGQIDAHDFHYAGFNIELLGTWLHRAGFTAIARVADFGLFEDSSVLQYRGAPISLNMSARKPAAGG